MIKDLFLENKYIDTTTIRVYVQENPSEEVRQFYTQADNLVLLTEESRKYWAEETDNGFIRLTFGDGMFGYKPVNGAKIFVSYLVCNGPVFNGITGNQNFKFSGTAYGSSGVTLLSLLLLTVLLLHLGVQILNLSEVY